MPSEACRYLVSSIHQIASHVHSNSFHFGCPRLSTIPALSHVINENLPATITEQPQWTTFLQFRLSSFSTCLQLFRRSRNSDHPQMPNRKFSISIVLISLLVFYNGYRTITSVISSLRVISNPAIKTDVAASVLDFTNAKRRKAEARQKFEGAWETVRSELLIHFEKQNMPEDAREWYKRVSTVGESVHPVLIIMWYLYRTWIIMFLAVN